MGTHEYLNAIEQLGMLVNLSDADQIEVYDRILGEQTEFSYYSGKLLNALNAPSSELSKNIPAADERSRFRRQTLKWLIALARIEIGATVAMYGDAPNAFEFLAPEEFGLEQYYAVLMDDVAAHLKALESDPIFKKTAGRSGKADSTTLAYLRRLEIIQHMLQATRNATNGEFVDSAEKYLREVDRATKLLTAKAELASADLVNSNVERSTSTSRRSITDYKAGSVRSLSPITSECQRTFLRMANGSGQ